MEFQVTLTPAESRRLIAKGVVKLPELIRAYQEGILVVALGLTNACILEELGVKLERSKYLAGYISDRGCVLPRELRASEYCFSRGQPIALEQALDLISSRDVFIKGANAIDPNGVAGIFLASRTGGTIGRVIGTLMARGVQLIIPASIAKRIPHSISELASKLGLERIQRAMGPPLGIMPIHGKLITELEAFKLLGAREALLMGGLGAGAAPGSLMFYVEAPQSVFELVAQIKGEPEPQIPRGDCSRCEYSGCMYRQVQRK